MSGEKDDPRELIRRMAEDHRQVAGLSGVQLESIVAEILRANAKSFEIVRGFSSQADLVVSIRNQLQGFERIKVELKAMRASIDAVAIQQLHLSVQALQAHRGIFVTTSQFTERARELAAALRPALQLVDGSGLAEWARFYQAQQEAVAATIAFRIKDLTLQEVSRLQDAEVEAVTEERASSHLIVEPFREPLIRVDRLPLRLLRAVMRDPRHVRRLTPRQFEEFTAEILDTLGFQNVLLTPRSGDGGRDVIASRVVEGISLVFYFECKKYAEDNKVQLDSLRALLGVVAHHSTEANIGVLVTTSTFTAGARQLIMSESRLDGKDYDDVLGWVSTARERVSGTKAR
jgi:restriction endonuclease Mrr